MPYFTIVIPSYNRGHIVGRAIESVLNQSYSDFEIIVVDDGSTDNTKEVVCQYLDSRINYFFQENSGVSAARNTGSKLAKGDYIAFIDSDDIWYKNKIKIQIKFMTANKALFSFNSYNIINKENKIIGAIKAQKKIDYKSLLKSCDIGLSTVMFHKSLKKYIIFPKLKTKEDYVVWLRLVKNKINLFGINNFLSAWRKVNNSLSSSVYQKMIDGYKVYRIYEKKSIISSIIFLFILSVSFIKKRYNSKFI